VQELSEAGGLFLSSERAMEPLVHVVSGVAAAAVVGVQPVSSCLLPGQSHAQRHLDTELLPL
jgi:hypothetical protein